MATITITVPDAKANKVYDAFDRAYNDPTENPTNTQKLAFVKARLVSFIREVVNADDINQAETTAKAGVVADDTVAS